MSELYEAYATDPKAEAEGVWIEFRAGAKLKVRSQSSLQAREWALRRAKGQRQLIMANGGALPPSLMDKNELDMCVEILVVDWQGVNNGDGHAIPFTRENLRKVLTDLPVLRRDVMFVSQVDESFRVAELESMGKTSATPSEPSSGSASGETPS